MTEGVRILLTEIVAPSVAGVLFLLFALYLRYANTEADQQRPHLSPSLFCFALFFFGRPVQLLVGEHPLPLVTVSVRFYLFCAVCTPLLYLAFAASDAARETRWRAFAWGHGFAFLYILFHAAACQGAKVLLQAPGLVLRDNDVLALHAPWYGREVSLVVQTLPAFVFMVLPAWRRLRDIMGQDSKQRAFLSGTALYGLFMIVGSLTMQWWIFYLASVLCAAIWAVGIAVDIRANRTRAAQLGHALRCELLGDASMLSRSDEEFEQFFALARAAPPDTFMVLGCPAQSTHPDQLADREELIVSAVRRGVDGRLPPDEVLIVPLSSTRWVIGLSSKALGQHVDASLMTAAEAIREAVESTTPFTVAVGLGSPSADMESLRESYRKVYRACDRATRLGGNMVLHVEDLKTAGGDDTYPLLHQERLLNAVGSGDPEKATASFQRLLEALPPLSGEIAPLRRLRLSEITVLAAEQAVRAGVARAEIRKLSDGVRQTLEQLRTTDEMIRAVQETIVKLADLVDNPPTVLEDARIQRAKDFIEEKYAEPMTLDEVARAACVSPSYFRKIFKEATDTTFSAYLNRTRIEKACELLRDPERTVTDVAFSVGFSDSNYFSTVFKKHTGESPREYRKI